VLVTLETEETISPKHTATASGAGAVEVPGTIRKVHDECAEVTAHLAESHFVFSVPPDAEVSFSTPLVQVRWLLRLELVVLPALTLSADAPPALPQRMHWVMPLVVRPPHDAWCRAPALLV
jgi:hypothetical protein